MKINVLLLAIFSRRSNKYIRNKFKKQNSRLSLLWIWLLNILLWLLVLEFLLSVIQINTTALSHHSLKQVNQHIHAHVHINTYTHIPSCMQSSTSNIQKAQITINESKSMRGLNMKLGHKLANIGFHVSEGKTQIAAFDEISTVPGFFQNRWYHTEYPLH